MEQGFSLQALVSRAERRRNEDGNAKEIPTELNDAVRETRQGIRVAFAEAFNEPVKKKQKVGR